MAGRPSIGIWITRPVVAVAVSPPATTIPDPDWKATARVVGVGSLSELSAIVRATGCPAGVPEVPVVETANPGRDRSGAAAGATTGAAADGDTDAAEAVGPAPQPAAVIATQTNSHAA